MTQSATNPVDDAGEIDRIIQEIESMEKEMDNVKAAPATKASPVAPTNSAQPEALPEPVPASTSEHTPVERDVFEEALAESSTAKVVPIRDLGVEATEHMDSSFGGSGLSGASVGSGGLALKVGGCSTISLEFEQDGVRIALRLESETLSISTDAGAEFRVPLKRKAA